MHLTFFGFIKQSLTDYLEAIVNLLIFFPYFFSVPTLLRTFFSPWKHLVTGKSKPGFSFNALLEQLSFNLISRFMGAFMRSSLIIFFVILQISYVVLILPITVLYILILPLIYVLYISKKTVTEKKAILKKSFVTRHLLKSENIQAVQVWFEQYYQAHVYKMAWWKLKNLFSYPPLARDWAVGYTPTLDQYSEDLTTSAYQVPRTTTMIGRNREIKKIEEVLLKNLGTNVVIVGEEGVGKHTIIDTMAKKIYEGQCPPQLAYYRLLKLNLEKILTVSQDQKQRENTVEQLFGEASRAGNIILMIENLDKYVASGSDRVDLTIPIEKFTKTGTIRFIATSSPFLYQKFIFNNNKINRSFVNIEVKEISENEALAILLEIAPIFELKNNIVIPYESLKETIEKSEFYITNIPFPEKAIDLLDNACSYVKLHGGKNGQYKSLTPEIIDTVLTEKTHMPTRLNDDMRSKLITLEQTLSQRVLHQENAINKLASAMRRSFIMLGKRKKPLASFLFLGPTGVGKTETAKAVAEMFFGSNKYLIRFDMSLYQNKENIRDLVGSMDSNTPGLITNAIRENPYAVLLLDEIEKANHDLINIFLTLLDEGYLTDGFGKRVDCKNLIIIATSNAGADFIFKEQLNKDQTDNKNYTPLSVGTGTESDDHLIAYLISQKLFTPEFLNRFDGVVVYQPLTGETVNQLARNIINRVASNLYKLYKVKVEISDATIKDIVDRGYKREFGARNLEHIIQLQIEDKIAKLILEHKTREGETIVI